MKVKNSLCGFQSNAMCHSCVPKNVMTCSITRGFRESIITCYTIRYKNCEYLKYKQLYQLQRFRWPRRLISLSYPMRVDLHSFLIQVIMFIFNMFDIGILSLHLFRYKIFFKKCFSYFLVFSAKLLVKRKAFHSEQKIIYPKRQKMVYTEQGSEIGYFLEHF